MPDRLSRRGARLAASPPFPEYIRENMARWGERWTRENPDGYVPLSVAENLLLGDGEGRPKRTTPTSPGGNAWLGRRTLSEECGAWQRK